MAFKKTKALSAERIARTVLAIAEIDPAAVLTGGTALQLYGSPRFTADVDVLVRTAPDVTATKRLSFGGVRTKVGGVPVDFIVRTDDVAALYGEAIAQAVSVKDVALRVARPEHIAVMKMYAGRRKDVDDLMRLLRAPLDRELLLRITEAHLGVYASKEMKALIEETDWRKSRAETADEDEETMLVEDDE